MRKLKGLVSQNNTAMVFINQLREKAGFVMGNPEVTPGGRALKFYSSCRIDLRRTGSIKKGDEVLGNSVRAKLVKNKVAPPFRTAEFDIVFGQGMDNIGCVLDQAVKHKMMSLNGSWYTFGEERIGNGREAAKDFLRGNADKFTEIENKVREIIFPDAEVVVEEEPGDDAEVV
jgi:recombination protein RecA